MNLGGSADALLPDLPPDADDYTKELRRRLGEAIAALNVRIDSVIPYCATPGETLICDPNAQNNLNWGTVAAPFANIITQDEGVQLSATVSTLNFVGAGVTASGAGSTTTITIPGGGGGGAFDYGKAIATTIRRIGY